MVDYGVTVDGFVAKTYNIIIEEEKTKAREFFGADVDLTLTSPLYQFIAATAFEKAVLWQQMEATYYAGYIDTAEGANLDKVIALLGVTRNPAVKATGVVEFTGLDTSVIPAGSKVETSTGVQFETDEEVVISGTTIDADITAIVSGTSGNVSADTIIIITTPTAGISSVNNDDATTGAFDAEDDPDLRIRAKGALEVAGKGTIPALLGAVGAVDGVVGISANEDLINHTVLLTVEGTFSDQDVIDVIEDTRPAGIQVTYVQPIGVDIYINITVLKEVTAPASTESDVQNALVNYINNLGVDGYVYYNDIIAVAMGVTGVLDVQAVELRPASLGSFDTNPDLFTSGTTVKIGEETGVSVLVKEVPDDDMELTVTYVNQAGTTGRTGDATIPLGSAIGTSIALILQPPDTGAREITACVDAGTGSYGEVTFRTDALGFGNTEILVTEAAQTDSGKVVVTGIP